MASNITIREMTPDDRDEILQFMEDEEFDPMSQNIGYAGFWGLEIEIDRPGEDFFRLAAIDSEGSAIGVLVGYKNDLLGIHVHKDYRRRGIARQLCAAYCDELRSVGYCGVKTDATPLVKAFCEAVGFIGFVSSRLGSADGEPTGYKMFKAFPNTLDVCDRSEPVEIKLRAFSVTEHDYRQSEEQVEFDLQAYRQSDGTLQFDEPVVLGRIEERIVSYVAFELETGGEVCFLGSVYWFEEQLQPLGFRFDAGRQIYFETLCPDLTHVLA